jgi:hypothetical protein
MRSTEGKQSTYVHHHEYGETGQEFCPVAVTPFELLDGSALKVYGYHIYAGA